MNPIAMSIAALVVLPAFGLVTWAWLTMAQIEEDLRVFSGVEGRYFEIGPQATKSTEGARWPVPG